MKDPSCWNSFRVPNWQHSGSESRIRIGIVSPLAATTFHFCYKDELLTRGVERGRVMGEMRFGGSLICPISRNHLGGGISRSRDRNYQDKECGEMVRLSLSLSLLTARIAQATKCRGNFHRAQTRRLRGVHSLCTAAYT